jgi:hypothetical protein
LLQRAVGVFQEPGDAETLAGLDDVQAVMRDGRANRRRRLGRADVHPTVNLHRIDADDLRAQTPGELAPNASLTAGGAAEDKIEFAHLLFIV